MLNKFKKLISFDNDSKRTEPSSDSRLLLNHTSSSVKKYQQGRHSDIFLWDLLVANCLSKVLFKQ